MNNKINAPARVEPLFCPVCPGDYPKTRRKATDLVCGDCYREYANEAVISLAKGKFQNIFEWVAEKAPTILTSLEVKYASAKAEIESLQDEVGKEAFENLKKSSGGKAVPREIWEQAYRQKEGEIWRAKGGNVKFARTKSLESRIALLKGILEKARNPEPKPAEPTPAPASEAAPVPQSKSQPCRRSKREPGEKPNSNHRAMIATLRQQELEEEAREALSASLSGSLSGNEAS